MTKTSSPDPTAPRWQRRKEARPAEILDAALNVFLRQGYAATRIQDVAKQAGVTTGTIYLYFANKEAVFEASVMKAMDEMLTPSEQRVSAHEGTMESLLVELTRRWWKLTVLDPRYTGFPVLVMAEAERFPDMARHWISGVLERGFSMYARILERGIATGEFRPHDTHVGALLLMAPVQYAQSYNWALKPYDSVARYDRAYIDQHLDTFLRGIRAEPRS